jgi:metallo-beta-lactamase class B
MMKSWSSALMVAAGLAIGAGGLDLLGQAVPRDVMVHVDAAKAAGGQIWPSLVSNLCDPATRPPAPPAARGTPPPGPPALDTWYMDPVKVFDNMYVLSTHNYAWNGTTVWAIKTSAGLILIDALFDYTAKEQVDNGLKKLGLNPADIKDIFITHGHGDHFGGAKYLQELYNPHVYMSAADWDYMDKQAQAAVAAGRGPGQPLPKKDLVITDGQKFTLGDTTITVYITPGHTPGTISFLIPVKINGQPHMAAFWGGTAISPNTTPDNLKLYAASVRRFENLVREQKVDVMLSNHDAFGEYWKKIDAMKANPQGRNPFIVGTDGVLKFLQVLDECSQANFAAVAARKS